MSSFTWLNNFHQGMTKAENYAEKTLAAYRLGMRAKGAIVGVRVAVDEQTCCQFAREQIDPEMVYTPDNAPHVPLVDCPLGAHCTCVYRPVMKYEVVAQDNDDV